jgi:hypothetical protein
MISSRAVQPILGPGGKKRLRKTDYFGSPKAWEEKASLGDHGCVRSTPIPTFRE